VDKLFLRELKVETVIGFWEWERHVTQTVTIDIEVATDARRAAATDTIGSALNYEQLANRVIEVIGAAQFKLVESLAETVAEIALGEFGSPWVKVSVAKPGAIRAARDVGIVIERSRGDA
jgi:dihydroneopterin aldolase